MKDSLRRPVLFAVIVITGSILILFDIPLIILIPVVLIVGFVILLVLGAITVAEIKTTLQSLKPANVKKIGIFKKLDGMKFFEKSTPVQKDTKPPVKAEVIKPVKGPGKKGGIGLHLNSFVSSIKTLGTLLKARSKSGKKVDEINKQLDNTVMEKVERSSALASAGDLGVSSVPPPYGGAGSTSMGTTKDQDPFLSLSDDEFDAGLLDSLGDLDSPQSNTGITESSSPHLPDTSSLEIYEPDIPLPSLDIDGQAENILKDNDMGLEEFSSLDGGDAIDNDFGDLDNLSLDDVDLDDEAEENSGPSSVPPPAAAPVIGVAPLEPEKEQVKTEWIKSDAPKDAGKSEDPVSTQEDMATFAGGGGQDADLLSSLASDVKFVKKEKDLSLLRDLKDFKAPAVEIESELNDMYTRMGALPKPEKNKTPPHEEIK
jgi:hypothetical protein